LEAISAVVAAGCRLITAIVDYGRSSRRPRPRLVKSRQQCRGRRWAGNAARTDRRRLSPSADDLQAHAADFGRLGPACPRRGLRPRPAVGALGRRRASIAHGRAELPRCDPIATAQAQPWQPSICLQW
jgi:hypothetical protein